MVEVRVTSREHRKRAAQPRPRAACVADSPARPDESLTIRSLAHALGVNADDRLPLRRQQGRDPRRNCRPRVQPRSTCPRPTGTGGRSCTGGRTRSARQVPPTPLGDRAPRLQHHPRACNPAPPRHDDRRRSAGAGFSSEPPPTPTPSSTATCTDSHSRSRPAVRYARGCPGVSPGSILQMFPAEQYPHLVEAPPSTSSSPDTTSATSSSSASTSSSTVSRVDS